MRTVLFCLLLGACTTTHLVVLTKDGDRVELDSNRLFQQTGFKIDPSTGELSYTSDPQAQQATELVKAGAAAFAKGAATGAGMPIP